MTRDPKQVLADLHQREAFARFKDGATVMLPGSRTAYTIENVHATPFGVPCCTVRRLEPKLSKAEKKRAKKAARGKPRGLL